ncbi:hypothetical protein ACSSNL_13140 [Thalassobius sp. S69A]|uniref:hypothetical protein n=1 Tax=unclassified Thalassovita TaxID=2619711 RepID=UPI000C596E38|nr:hypothetical protein [Paracoccaceae bacterium]
MTKYMIAAAAVTLATPLWAEGIDAAIDTDGDGAYSLQEVQAVSDAVTQDVFNGYDISADGLLDAAEAAAMVEAGLLPQQS